MAAETLAFTDGFDNAFLIKHDMQCMLGREIPLLMDTDSKILFDVLTRHISTTEKWILADIAATREPYENHVISNVALIRSDYNPADGLTKVQPNSALIHVMETNKLDHPIEQYIKSPQICRVEEGRANSLCMSHSDSDSIRHHSERNENGRRR